MTRLGFGAGKVSSLRQQVVERLVLHIIHVGVLHGVDHDIGGVVRAVAALCPSSKSVTLLSRHEHELAALMPG